MPRAPRLASSTRDEINGIKIKLVQLDDASDPSTGTRDARKLIEQDKVDVLMGAGSTPTTLAIATVSSRVQSSGDRAGARPETCLASPARGWLHPAAAAADGVRRRRQMKAAGVKTVGYIGYNDALGRSRL